MARFCLASDLSNAQLAENLSTRVVMTMIPKEAQIIMIMLNKPKTPFYRRILLE